MPPKVNAELSKLKGKREQIIKDLEIFTTFLEGFNDSKLQQLKARLESIEKLRGQFKEVQLNIKTVDVNFNEEVGWVEYARFENCYWETMQKARSLIPTERMTSTPVSQILNTTAVEPRINLPTLSLPTFTGNYEQFAEFRDTFAALVHNNDGITNVQKFYYLRAALKQEAAKVVQALEVSDVNYTIAWDLLKERFENLKLLVREHIKEIFEAPILTREDGGRLRAMTDTLTRNVRCLKALNIPVDTWDLMLIYVTVKKLDYETKRAWESEVTEAELPTLKEFTSFLQKRCNLLETLNKGSSEEGLPKKTNRSHAFVATNERGCPLCKGQHSIYQCSTMLELTVERRRDKVKSMGLCFNCLRSGHNANACKGRGCFKCGKRHHSLLHTTVQPTAAPESTATQAATTATSTSIAMTATSIAAPPDAQAILSTAVVEAKNEENKYVSCRILLDCGSQSNFITNSLCDKLKLNREEITFAVNGLGATQNNIRSKVRTEIKARFGKYRRTLEFLVLDVITGNIPACSFTKERFHIPNYIRLADDTFHESGRIDMILGADVFWEILGKRRLSLGSGLPMLQQSALGWFVAGRMSTQENGTSNSHAYCSTGVDLTKFWEQEEVSSEKTSSTDDVESERHFQENTRRSPEGRFIVKIPLKDNINELCKDSRGMAVQRLHGIERRLKKNDVLRKDYAQGMTDYVTSGHMAEVREEGTEEAFYLPHHGVYKEASLTTKLRIVFDGSARTESGLSLNQIQRVGGVVQSELFEILTRFRTYKYVISADIEKMYRQIMIDKSQWKLQRILWREAPEKPIVCYEMSVLMFGMASSPFLATRCLLQLSKDSQQKYPLASKVIHDGFYVDDLLTGGDTIDEVLRTRNEIISILREAKFNLRKWTSNCQPLMNDMLGGEDAKKGLSLGDNAKGKTLGLIWDSNNDTLSYELTIQLSDIVTKRHMLRTIASIFDPLGLVAPCIITVKMMLQALWLEKLGWDEPVSKTLENKWMTFIAQLGELNGIQIGRYAADPNQASWELHGFSDASKGAFGACVYLRSRGETGFKTKLLCAKSKVAPLKSLTIPRLELCGAVLLTRLMAKVYKALKVNDIKSTLWCDSTIVLAWIKTMPHLLQVFVGNRIAEIQNFKGEWRHVRTAENPADMLSRGITPREIKDAHIWWHGPPWLETDEIPVSVITAVQETALPELRPQALIAAAVEESLNFEKFSSLEKAQRVVAYIQRFVHNAQVSKEARTVGPITVPEMKISLKSILRIIQKQGFRQEYDCLTAGKGLAKRNHLNSLSPFMDEDRIIRVGGRLRNSDQDYDSKHQMLLPKGHHVTELIFTGDHRRLLHCGPQQLLANIRQKYWPIAGRYLARKTTRSCVTCFKAKPRQMDPVMGNLPRERVVPAAPFYHTGVDFAGPFKHKDKRGRGAREIKCYICLFVCFSTRATHLELVGDLSTDAYIAALRRFVGRRGKPAKLFSDNGTNFIGASNDLRKTLNKLQSDPDLQSWCAGSAIEFVFIPPRAPHFGGIWERAVRSVKHHLNRMTSSTLLCYEEFLTILIQIEAVLNSRPLCPLSTDPSDLNPLTPGHFLIGRPLTAVLDERLQDVKIGRLSRYQMMQNLIQVFWKRFKAEYLNQLQAKAKWYHEGNQKIDIGDMVIVTEDNTPPCAWRVGRITSVCAGSDGVVRVAEVKTATGHVKRAVRHLCVLPIRQGDGTQADESERNIVGENL